MILGVGQVGEWIKQLSYVQEVVGSSLVCDTFFFNLGTFSAHLFFRSGTFSVHLLVTLGTFSV